MKKIFVAITILLFGLTTVGSQQITQAAYNPLNYQACKDAPDSSVCQQASNQGDKNPVIEVVNTGIKILGWVVGVTSVILVMIGGFSYIASAGNPEKTATAKKRVIYALVGLAIAALAWAIVHFITNRIL